MNRLYFLATLATFAALAACSGGGSSGGVTPPTNTTSNTVAFSANYLGGTLAAAARRPRSANSCASTAATDIAVENLADYNPHGSQSLHYFDGYNVGATEYASGCQVVSTSPAWSSDNASVAALNGTPAYATGISTPAPGTVNVWSKQSGLAHAVATFTDGTTASVKVHSYDPVVIGCSSNAYANMVPAWSASQGNVPTVAAADVFMASSRCQAPFNDPTLSGLVTSLGMLVFPYGYQVLAQSNPPTAIVTPASLVSVTSASGFTSQGNDLGLLVPPTDANNAPSGVSQPYSLIVFKTSTGAFVKALLMVENCDGSWGAFQNSPTSPIYASCTGGVVTLLVATSNASGSFAY